MPCSKRVQSKRACCSLHENSRRLQHDLQINYLLVPELEEPPILPDEPDEPLGVLDEESVPELPDVPELPGMLEELEPPAPEAPELPGVLEDEPAPVEPEVLAPLGELDELDELGVLDELDPVAPPEVPELPGVAVEDELDPPAAPPEDEVSPPEVLPAAPVLGVLEEDPAPVVPAAPEELEELGALLLGVLELEELGGAPSSDFLPQPAISRANALAARTSLDAFIIDFIMSFLSIKLIGC